MKKLFLLLAATILVGEISTIPASAQEEVEEADQVDITTMDCRTVLKMDDNEQEYTMVFYHGYVTGKNDEKVIARNLAEITDKVIEYCIDNPESTMLSAFEKHRPISE